jgi:hypothetical protein
MELLRNIPVEVSSEQVSRMLRIDQTRVQQMHGEDLVKIANSLVDPKALYTIGYITNRKEDTTEIDERRLASRVLAGNLEKVGRVFPYIITVGSALEDEASTYSMFQRLFLENAADLALTSARVHVERYLSKRYELGNVSHLGPGQLDWPIQQQKELFSFFKDVETTIGVRLTESFLMIPRKSISGIIFPKEVTFIACQLCPRENCLSRQAAYSEDLRKSHGLDTERN